MDLGLYDCGSDTGTPYAFLKGSREAFGEQGISLDVMEWEDDDSLAAGELGQRCGRPCNGAQNHQDHG
jgi:hypothetical protein